MSYDPFSHIFSTDESIMEIMMIDHTPQDEHHHHSSLPDSIEDNLSNVYFPNFVEPFTNFASIHEVEYEKNLLNIKEMIPIDISIKLGIVQNIRIGVSFSPSVIKIYRALFHEFQDIFSWTYEEMPSINPNIVVHEIKTYLDAKPIQQCFHPVHPKNATEIKAEVEKLL